MEVFIAIVIGVLLCYIGVRLWKHVKFFSFCLIVLGILGPILYFETGPGSNDDEINVSSIYDVLDDDYSSEPSFKGHSSNIKGACKYCDCEQYDGIYDGHWPKCSCGHSYAGHETN